MQGQALDDRGANFVLSMIRGIGPKDEVEAMMAAQMAAEKTKASEHLPMEDYT